MDCSVLGTLVVNHEPIDLIDVRSKNEFAAMHIPGAQSLPFGELVTPGIFRGRRLTAERVYVISEDGHAQASLATGILRSAGCVNAVPVDGGMKIGSPGVFQCGARDSPPGFRPISPVRRCPRWQPARRSRCTSLPLRLSSSPLPGWCSLKRIFSRERDRGKLPRLELTHVINVPSKRNDAGVLEVETP